MVMPISGSEGKFYRGKRLRRQKVAGRDGRWLSILAEKLLSVFDEADDHDDCGAGHAHKEHDLQDMHCEDAESHMNDCIPDWQWFPSGRLIGGDALLDSGPCGVFHGGF